MPMHRTAASAALFLLASPALAHHGWGSYNAGNPVTFEGTIEAVSFENPHTTLSLTYDGKLWLVTLAPPSRMNNRGATAEVVVTGKPVKAHGYPKRDGAAEIRAEWIEVGGQHFELR